MYTIGAAGTKDLRSILLERVGSFLTSSTGVPGFRSGHSVRVGVEAGEFAAFIGRPVDVADITMISGVNHDAGKDDLRITELLHRPDRLTDKEQRYFNAVHTSVGGKLVMEHLRGDYAESAVWHIAAGAMLHHHPFSGDFVTRECWNLLFSNHERPPFLRGKRIPLVARIIGVVDAYDAMVNEDGENEDRAYKRGREIITPRLAATKLIAAAGSQFDPELVERYLTWRNLMPPVFSKENLRLRKALAITRLLGLHRLNRAR